MPTGTRRTPVQVKRCPERFTSDDKRVIARFFDLGESRNRAVIARVLALPDKRIEALYRKVHEKFAGRHRDIEAVFERHYLKVAGYIDRDLSRSARLLVGAYFTMEYAIESAALFNPSMAPAIDQSGCGPGDLRFIMSLRATGEGHVSSIVFRTGTISRDGDITFQPPGRYTELAEPQPDLAYEKRLFTHKLIEMGGYHEAAQVVLDALPDPFTLGQLDAAIAATDPRGGNGGFAEAMENLRWLARSNYRLLMPEGATASDIVIFPSSENESRGIEDVRITRFTDDDGRVTYYATYSAYNGYRVLPQMMETADPRIIQIHTLNGRFAQNKGMALFPRKVGGQYIMVSRIDGENLYLMRSHNPYFWNQATKLSSPDQPWEFVQIGNCGPPIETEAGWLLLTHGVGAMREYCIGVMLLDRDDPSRILGELEEPLLVPAEDERDGYVPNVVYSCGGLIHNGTLYLPYAVSDISTRFATVDVAELLGALT